jgi:hypothetical protein
MIWDVEIKVQLLFSGFDLDVILVFYGRAVFANQKVKKPTLPFRIYRFPEVSWLRTTRNEVHIGILIGVIYNTFKFVQIRIWILLSWKGLTCGSVDEFNLTRCAAMLAKYIGISLVSEHEIHSMCVNIPKTGIKPLEINFMNTLTLDSRTN